MTNIIRKIYRWAYRLIKYPFLPSETWITNSIRRRAASLSLDEAMRFLFRVEDEVERIENYRAIKLDKGIHPKHRLMNYHDFFVKRIQPGERVLDIGCGNGALSFDIAEKAGATVVGIEINPDNLSIAHQRFAHPRVDYRQGDIFKALPEERFDVVVLSNVLEHLAGRVELLKRIQKSASPRRFLVRVPLFERDWRVPLRRELGVEWRLDLTHEIEYSQESFEGEIRQAGLAVRAQETRWGEIWAELEPAKDETEKA